MPVRDGVSRCLFRRSGLCGPVPPAGENQHTTIPVYGDRRCTTICLARSTLPEACPRRSLQRVQTAGLSRLNTCVQSDWHRDCIIGRMCRCDGASGQLRATRHGRYPNRDICQGDLPLLALDANGAMAYAQTRASLGKRLDSLVPHADGTGHVRQHGHRGERSWERARRRRQSAAPCASDGT